MGCGPSTDAKPKETETSLHKPSPAPSAKKRESQDGQNTPKDAPAEPAEPADRPAKEGCSDSVKLESMGSNRTTNDATKDEVPHNPPEVRQSDQLRHDSSFHLSPPPEHTDFSSYIHTPLPPREPLPELYPAIKETPKDKEEAPAPAPEAEGANMYSYSKQSCDSAMSNDDMHEPKNRKHNLVVESFKSLDNKSNINCDPLQEIDESNNSNKLIHNINNSNPDISPEPKLTDEGDKNSAEVFKPGNNDDGQDKFDAAIRSTCLLTKPEELYQVAANNKVVSLSLTRALPHTIDLMELCSKLTSVTVVEIQGNNLGPQAFRALMYAMATNTSITSLNVADNKTDTDSAISVGKMLTVNRSLECLNVSGNHLGTDFFSRNVGPALATNNVLRILNCESIGSTDFAVLGENLKDNACLSELNIANNQLRDANIFMKGLDVWMQQTGCSIQVLQLQSIGLQTSGFTLLASALAGKNSLTSLNVSANEVTDSGVLLDFVLACCGHSTLTELTADNIRLKPQPWTPDGLWSKQRPCGLCSLSLSGCQLEDEHLCGLLDHMGQGTLANLTMLDLSNNSNLGVKAMKAVHTLTRTGSNKSSIKRLKLGLNSSQCMSGIFSFTELDYLNVRKASNTLPSVQPTETLVLDGIKLSGSASLWELLSSMHSLAALSLAGCQLSDKDVQPLFSSIAKGQPLHMLKLASNRLQDESITALVDALTAHKQHPLALLDISNNQVTAAGVKTLCELYTSNKHTSQLQSLNLATNHIDSEGVCELLKHVEKCGLLSVNVSGQEKHYEVQDMDDIYKQLANTLGLTVKEDNGSVMPGTSCLPNVPPSFNLKFQSLGGEAGELGQHLDSFAVSTDCQQRRVVSLTLVDALQLAAFFQGTDKCTLSNEEWKQVIGSGKGSPIWLELAENRERAVYFTGLPASITTQKLEGLLESEADCEMEDICLMKDVVTKQNNGIAWALLPDEESVQRAVDFYNRGEATVFGSQFVISRLAVHVDDSASSQAQESAIRDMAERHKSRLAEEAAHRRLIQQSYQESQQRHAYRLAHPAYADGRIW